MKKSILLLLLQFALAPAPLMASEAAPVLVREDGDWDHGRDHGHQPPPPCIEQSSVELGTFLVGVPECSLDINLTLIKSDILEELFGIPAYWEWIGRYTNWRSWEHRVQNILFNRCTGEYLDNSVRVIEAYRTRSDFDVSNPPGKPNRPEKAMSRAQAEKAFEESRVACEADASQKN